VNSAWPVSALVLLCAGVQVQAVDPLVLDFQAAFERLEARNESLKAARSTIEQARTEQAQADARRWPTIELAGRYTHLDAPIEADLRPIDDLLVNGLGQAGISLPTGLIPNAFRIQDANFFNLSLEAIQPIYLGGRIQAARAASRFGLQASQTALQGQRADLTVILVERYFGQLLARKDLAVRERSVASLREHDFNARRLEEEGQIARVERLRASVALAEAESEQRVARERLALASAALASLLASERPVAGQGPIPPLPTAPERAVWQAAARSNNPALLEVGQRIAQAQAGARAAQGELLPSVALFGMREIYTNDLTLIDPQWAFGVQASWTLFDGGQRRARAARARARVDELAWRLAAGQRDVALFVDQQVDRFISALEREQMYAATIELAEEALWAQRRAFEEGLGTSLEVIEAELARSRVTLGELAARRDAWIALAGLHAAAGQVEQLLDYLGRKADE